MDEDSGVIDFFNTYLIKTGAYGALDAQISDLRNRMIALEEQAKKHNFEAILIKMEERLSALEERKLDQVKDTINPRIGKIDRYKPFIKAMSSTGDQVRIIEYKTWEEIKHEIAQISRFLYLSQTKGLINSIKKVDPEWSPND